MNTQDALDRALEFLAPYGHELKNGLTSHAPMVAEVLCARGRVDALGPWLDSYRRDLKPWPPTREPIPDGEGWRDALGRVDRVSDWRLFVGADLATGSLSAGVERWVGRLVPGLCSDATHGVIRTAHALRALDRARRPARVQELCDAIAIWAATYQALPGADGEPLPGGPRPGVAIEAVERVPAAERAPLTTIVAALEGLERFAPFAAVPHAVALDGDPEDTVTELAETFARVFLTNANDTLGAIVFAHGVTSAVALRALLPHLRAETAARALRFMWQAGCGLYAALGTASPEAARADERAVANDALFDAALATCDEHAIKFADACLAEHARSGRPVFLRAAEHAVSLLTP